MGTRTRHYWANVRVSFWLLPALMIGGAALLALVILTVDTALAEAELPTWLYAGGAAGAYALLSTIAGSMVTVAALGFSIIIVALVMASSQFGPRLLNIFMRDRISQLMLGMFAGTFTFSVLILRSIREPSEPGEAFVPQISITVAILLTLLSVATLVYLFHHVAVSIQAPKVAATVARDLHAAIDHISSGGRGIPGPVPSSLEIPDAMSDTVLLASDNGYVQVVDDAAVMDLAQRHDVTVRMIVRPGLFVVSGNPIMVVRGTHADDPDVEAGLRSALIVGDVRTPEDDIEYAIRQLVEVALRALSPAINDPFTAMTAIDWLGSAMARLATADFPPRFRYDEDGRLRVVASVSTFAGIVHTVFSRIRHYGGNSPVVLNRLLEAVAAFGPHVRDDSDRELVRAEAESVLEMGRALVHNEADLTELDRRYRAAMAALGAPSSQ